VNYDFLIVGAGFFGATVAERLATSGLKVLVIDKRAHIGGNCYSEVDHETNIECHKYGSHIFHTSNEDVWTYINRFTSFNEYRHTVWTTFREHVYSMPINLSTINAYYGINLKPFEVETFIKKECSKENFLHPSNLEEKAISLIGRPLYEAFIKGYTIKQWAKDPQDLSADIITRLPVRHNYINRYFNDKYEGIPLNGYTSLFERMLDHPNIEVKLNKDYFVLEDDIKDLPTLYTGPIDRFFEYKHGHLDWRTIDFEREVLDISDYQGCSVMNYAEEKVPYTRIHEFKHFHPERDAASATVIYKEFSRTAGHLEDLYYPINTPRNRELLLKYQENIPELDAVWFGGRLGNYIYWDMDDAVAHALKKSELILKTLKAL